MSFHERVEQVAPFVYLEGYGSESPVFRRERYVYVLEYGHSLVSSAMEREPSLRLVRGECL